jgi:hypothetical protein
MKHGYTIAFSICAAVLVAGLILAGGMPGDAVARTGVLLSASRRAGGARLLVAVCDDGGKDGDQKRDVPFVAAQSFVVSAETASRMTPGTVAMFKVHAARCA